MDLVGSKALMETFNWNAQFIAHVDETAQDAPTDLKGGMDKDEVVNYVADRRDACHLN